MITKFKLVLLHEEASVFYALYSVTFSKPSATSSHKHALHGLTEHFGETNENVIIDWRKSYI